MASNSAEDIANSVSRRIKVLAGPGTGKSFAMKKRVNNLLEEGVYPQRILPITFTRVAAGALQRDLEELGGPETKELNARTIHSLALAQLGYSSIRSSFGRQVRILSDFEKEPLYADLRFLGHKRHSPQNGLEDYEAAWARLQHEEPGYAKSVQEQRLEDDLVAWLVFHKAMTIGEVIPLLYRHLSNRPELVDRDRYLHVLVDEYQDLNKAEQNLIDLLAGNADMCVVGDEDQSIYGFKHAHPEGIREWAMEDLALEQFHLTECFRCPTTVVGVANQLISNNKRMDRYPLLPHRANGKGEIHVWQFARPDDEARCLANEIKGLLARGVKPAEIMVLVTNRKLGETITDRLRAVGVSATSLFSEGAIAEISVRRNLELLLLSIDSSDRVALRWLLGEGDIEWRRGPYAELRTYCQATNQSPMSALRRWSGEALLNPLPDELLRKFEEIQTAVSQLQEQDSLYDKIALLFPETSYLRELAQRILMQYEDEGMEQGRFLSEFRRQLAMPEVAISDDDVRVMSVHKSKGLSAPIIFVSGCEEGHLPRIVGEDVSALAEQRRLFYVAISRVQALREELDRMPGTLVMSYAKSIEVSEAHKVHLDASNVGSAFLAVDRSRFLDELGDACPEPIFREDPEKIIL